MTPTRNCGLVSQALSIMSLSFPAVILVVMLVSGLSDCASVPISMDDLESLAASKILRDHTSSPTTPQLHFTRSNPKPVKELKENDELMMRRTDKRLNESRKDDTETTIPNTEKSLLSSASSNTQDSYEMMSSPLHVARCRANCLEKFNPEDANKGAAPTLPSISSRTTEDANTSPDEMHLLPMLRLRKRRSSFAPLNNFVNKKSSWNCLHNSTECFTCWKSCELLEPGKKRNTQEETSLSSVFPMENEEVNEATRREKLKEEMSKKEKESKQSILACSPLDFPECMGGCQVACSFYEGLFTKMGKNEEDAGEGGQKSHAFTSHPVVATKQESVLRIVPGKITWPGWNTEDGNKEAALSSRIPLPSSKSPTRVVPVVYVVIQEYPDRKWRQIAQTTEAEVEIPRELTSAMETKLCSVRVLAVGPQGLLSVYSPERTEEEKQLSDNSNNSEKVVVVDGEAPTTPRMMERKKSGSDGNVTPESRQDGLLASTVMISDSISSTNTNDHLETAIPLTISSTPNGAQSPASSSTTESQWSGIEERFGLRRVSLIHQKSLVIAELRWNAIGSNPSQEYLITWELTGGGLKGHLVTDSTSVTLSLWPDTLYRIQVQLFEQNLDGDGEQPGESSTTSLQSFPLTVDTSEASFPMESPSALLHSGGNDEDTERDSEEEDFEQEGNERGGLEEPAHKSITGFLNMTLALGVSSAAFVFVLVIFIVAAFTWTRMRTLSGRELITRRKAPCHEGRVGCCCYNGCFSSTREPQLLLEQDDLVVDDSSSTSFPSPFYAVKRQSKKNKRNLSQYSFGSGSHNQSGQQSTSPTPVTVAVISRCSSGLEASSSSSKEDGKDGCSYLNYYHDAPLMPSLGKVAVGEEGAIKARQQGCPSSSCWLPNATCTCTTNNRTTSCPVTTSSSSTATTVRTSSSSSRNHNIQQLEQQHYLHQIINNSSSKPY